MYEKRICRECANRSRQVCREDAHGDLQAVVYCRGMAGVEGKTVELDPTEPACRHFRPIEEGEDPDDEDA